MKLVLTLTASLLLSGTALAQQPQQTELELPPGAVALMTAPKPTGPVVNVLVGDPEIADVTALSDYRVAVTGKKVGSTTIMLLNAESQVVTNVQVAVVVKGPNRSITVFRGGRGIREVYRCDATQVASCHFERTDTNTPPVPIINVGPVIPPGVTVFNQPNATAIANPASTEGVKR